MTQELSIAEDVPTQVIGICLRGMNLKEYMKGCLDGTYPFPIGRDGKRVGGIPELPLVGINMLCGERVIYRTLDDLPETSVPCTCGNPNHWFVFIEKEKR